MFLNGVCLGWREKELNINFSVWNMIGHLKRKHFANVKLLIEFACIFFFLCIEDMAFLEETAKAVQVMVYTFVFLGVFVFKLCAHFRLPTRCRENGEKPRSLIL